MHRIEEYNCLENNSVNLFVGVGELLDLHNNDPNDPGMVGSCQGVELGVGGDLLVPGVRVPVKGQQSLGNELNTYYGISISFSKIWMLII